MKRSAVLGVLVAVGALATVLAADQQQPPQELQIEKVKDNLYNITGAGGNVAVFVVAVFAVAVFAVAARVVSARVVAARVVAAVRAAAGRSS